MQKRGSTIFKDVANEFLNFKQKSLSAKYFNNQKRKIQNYLYPTLENKPINEITKNDIIKIIKEIPKIKLPNDTKNSNKSETQRRIFILIKEILRFALHNDYIDKNVADAIDLNQLIPKQNINHFKAELDIKELKKIYKLINSYNSLTTKEALRFLILTALRVGNIRNLKWSYIDFEKKIITYPKEAMKAKEAFRLPLTDTLIDILNNMKSITSKYEYVFCSLVAPSKQMSENTLNFALKRMDLNITPHGFRSSFSTICYENQKKHNFSFEVIENQLAHKVGSSVVRAYLRSDFLDDRKKLLEWWEKVLKA